MKMVEEKIDTPYGSLPLKFDISLTIIGITFVILSMYAYIFHYSTFPSKTTLGILIAFFFFIGWLGVILGMIGWSERYFQEKKLDKIKKRVEMEEEKQKLEALRKPAMPVLISTRKRR